MSYNLTPSMLVEQNFIKCAFFVMVADDECELGSSLLPYTTDISKLNIKFGDSHEVYRASEASIKKFNLQKRGSKQTTIFTSINAFSDKMETVETEYLKIVLVPVKDYFSYLPHGRISRMRTLEIC